MKTRTNLTWKLVSVLVALTLLIPALFAGPVPSVQAADTGWRSPTANAADYGGDGDGFELNPTNAYADGGGYAESRNNGSVLGGTTERHIYYNYGLSVPTGATIYGIEVRLDWWLDSTSDTNTMGVELSWDGGTNWTTAKIDSQETTSQHTVILGSTSDTWGRTWSSSDFSNANFRVRIINYSSVVWRDFYLDWTAVRVTYNRPPSVAPALVSPNNGAYINDNTPLLDWNAATDPDGDTLTYAVSIDGGTYVDVGTATNYTTGALAQLQYTWQVRAYDGYVYSYSDIWSFTVDTDTPATPGHLYEGSPDQDYDPNTAYSMLVNWGSVDDTGSGITYQLQRRINGGAWSADDIYSAGGTSFTDAGTYADNTLIEYRVRACTGAGNCSDYRISDGIRIDSQNPATVTGVGEGDAVGTDDDWDQDNTYYVYWNRVADTGSGISYQVQRSVNAGAYSDVTLAGVTCDATRCWGDDPTGYSDGDAVRYQVRAVNGAGRTSLAWSTPSDGITLDLQPPDSNVTTGGVYNPVSWPDQIAGTASDGGSGVTRVDITIYDSDAARWWDGDSWETGGPFWIQASGTTAWTYAFPESNLTDGNTYQVQSRATDVAGNVETDYGTNQFTYAAAAPEAPVPTSTTHPDPDTWYNNNQPSFAWNEPDSPIGIQGYSILLDQYPGTIPDKIQDTTQRTYDAATTPDGVWYFHVRAVDVTGQWGPAGHVRVQIDTTTPQMPGSVTEENPDVDWDADGGITVYWSAVPNTGSGISYALERCVNGGLTGACTTSWQSVVSGVADTYYAHNPGGYTDGNTVRYRVRATNGVGLSDGWATSDGMTIDSDPVAAPAWVYEDATAEPDRDYHNQANGAVTVHWAAVADTGSGITYRLEKRIGAGTWTLVAQNLDVTSYADAGSYSDGNLITYRVTAINGVSTEGSATLSDGFTIDLDIPALPAWVREGVATDPDWDYDDDGSFTVYWAAVSGTGSGITYRLEKSVDGADWQLVAENISGASQADTNPTAPDGAFIRYRVTPVNGAGTSGSYRLSDGITLDRESPSAPAWIYENNPDVDFDADGAVWVNWAAVANTGSGITYDLQKQVNGGGWLDRATGLAVTSFNDTVTYGDETLIEYRVIARNSVGYSSGWTASDGVRVDTDTPAQVTGVGEGDVAGVDDDYDENNTFFVYWTAVAPTATGDQIYYQVERNVNGGGWSVAVSGLTATSWDDPQAYSNGDNVSYRVAAINGAGTSGDDSAASDGITIDTGQPNSVIATSGYYNAVNWPDRVQGAASDDYSGIAQVEIIIYDTDANLWWNGSAWATGGPFWLLVPNTTWTYALADSALTDGHTYDLQSRATDVAGNVEGSYGTNSFIFATSGPEAPAISSSTHPVQTTWYNHNDPAFTWTTPGGPAPIVGYSYLLDQSPATTPDAVADTTGNTASYVDVSDGTWYFHVRALDNAGVWGPAGHFAVHIDTATPAAPVSVTDESPDVDYDYDGSVTVYWTAVPDTGSGIVYVVERQIGAGSWTVLIDTVPSTQYLDPATGYADGTFIRYRVSARNGVGLTGATTGSDGFTVDNDAPLTPAWVTENAADPNDEDYDPDGSVRIYWAASNDTSSGLTYRLERRITVGGIPGSWTEIASGLAGTSYLDPRANQDGETLHYRITAVNGVGSSNAPAVSDGILIDIDTPAAPAEVTENSPDVDWSVDGSVTVFWGSVGDTGSGIVYELWKQVNNGTWMLVADNLPGGTTSYADSGVYNDGDTVRYRVRATNGAGTSGTWRESDGMTIDASTPAAPGWVREENPDIDYDADGALTVYWAAVSDTGSGITYRLEKELNNSDVWNVVAQGLATTSYYDGQTQSDGTIIHYRVTAVNGVGTAGSATASDGVTVDTQSPAAPTDLGEGDMVGTDDVFDQDNTFYVFWTASADTGSGITYDIQKSINGGTWVAAASGVAGTSWEDPTPYSNGDTVQYRVRAVNGAGLEGAWSSASSGITLDFVRPDSAVTTGGYYNAFNWPGFILGTSSDTGSDVAIVHITIQRASDGQYWSGAAWQGSEAWLAAAGTINWQYGFAPADGETYDIRSRATDYAGNVEITYGVGSFTYSSSGPQTPEISSSTHPNEATWYDNDGPTFNWTEPSSTAPVVGYSYVLDQNPGTTPDAVADTTARTVSYSGLADGVWYFHVRALDDADNWGPADHFAVHIDTATPAAPGQPTEELPDVDFDADGSFSVYWAGVADTGSGITYRLERDSGAGWTLVVTTTATNYADSGSYADGTFIRYRVRAINGVGLASGWSPNSDGVTIDSDVPAAPAWVREGVDTDPDWDWDADGAYTVYWAGVDNTGSGIEYRLSRRINGGAWELLTTTANTFYADSGSYPDGTLIEYQVVAVNGAGTAGSPTVSDGIRIDSDVPAPPASITEGSPDVDWDYDGVFTVYWSAVADTGSGITYRLERNLNGAGWTIVATQAGVSYADDIGNTDGTTVFYRVTAINGVGTEGAPRVSDGLTVDSQAVPQPGWVREDSATDPDRDYHPNGDGAITVYWASVADTGSGVRYRLEKRVNGDPNPWALVAANLSSTSYPDSGAYSDNDFIEYRVTAVNGVLTESAPRLSDGMRIDTDIPAPPTDVGEGDTPGVDDDFDQDNVFDVFWTAPADTGSGLSYTIQRSRNGGAWEQAVAGQSCTTTPCQWDDPVPYSNGDTVQYRALAVNGAGRQSDASTASDGITLDFAQPDSAVSTGGYYNAFNWPGMVRGTAADAISDVDVVDVTIYDVSTSRYWDSDSWETAVTWLRATGTLNWQYTLASADLTEGHTYDVRSRATDRAGNVEATPGTGSFTYASEGPQSPAVSSTSHPVQANWYNDNAPVFNWTTPDSVAPVVGYSYVLDQNPGTTPAPAVNTTGNTQSYTGLADGVWYFHVRALDDADNWGPAGHYRINIDTATPNAPASVTEATPDVDWDADGSFTVYWGAVADTGSGITYALERCVNGGLSGACTTSWEPAISGLVATQYADNVGATDNTTVRYRVHATNGVGLSGAWTTSDGLTVDSDAPGSPGPVTEGNPTPDIAYDADGNFTVYWNAVADTGSSITYRLERSVNGAGYTLIADGLTVVSYAVSGTYNDNDTVRYRVTAVNGVGTMGPSAESSGVIIDNQTPAAPTSVTEESPDVDWDVDGNARVYWSAVADTGSGITYRLERRVNGSGWTLVSGAEGLTVTDFQVDGVYNDDDLIEFRVRAANGVGLTGLWTASDGVRVDSSIPATPGNVTENSPDVDFLADAAGAPAVYWVAVLNTGSGITYRVERELNNSGAWTLVGTTAGTSLTDSGGSYADDTFIRYRVIAITGVGTSGAPGLSDGVRIDTDTPAVPTNMGEGDAVGADDDYDENNTFYVFWDGITPTATGDTITYIIQRSRNGGVWEQAATTTATSWEDPVPFSNGDTVNYRVIAQNGAGTQSVPAAPSDGLTLDFVQPDSAVTTGGFYNAFTWPGFIYGTASDGLSGVAFVDITLRDAGSGQYWDGSAWDAGVVWLRATGTTNWQYSFAPTNGHTYDVQSRAADAATNVETSFSARSFTYAASGPQAPVVSSSTHPDQGTWYADNAPTFNWTTPSSGAGIQGYSFLLDQSPSTTPDTILEALVNTFSYVTVADGTWYFHVRAQDNAGNWGPAGHFRVNIDMTPPPALTSITEDTPDVDWDADGNIVIYWDPVTDLSGVTYTLERNINNAGWTQVATAIAATSYADFSTNADGATVRYRVRATNGVAMHSAWTESDGMTIDSSPPTSPTPVTEGDPDIDWSADGTVTARWAAVTDTGSGVTYRLERGVNGVWTTIAPALSANVYADSGAYNDDDFIQYRVTAVSGVGLASPPATSDGMQIDSQTPASPASVTEETPDVDWDLDGNVTVYWSAVADTGSGLTYRLERNVNHTGWTVVTTQAGTTYADSGVYNHHDFIEYRVTAINGVGRESAPRVSDGVTVDSATPGTPGSVSENDPDIDYHPNADGAVTVYWSTVANTGSGLTYRLERNVNGAGWTVVAGGIGGAAYADSGAYADDDFIQYRVTAVNGVGTAGAAGLSDGMRIDLDSPAVPSGVGEGDGIGVDDDFDQDNDFYVFWEAVAPTATGDTITYIVQRSRNGGAWELATTTTAPAWEDPLPYSNNDTVNYRVLAVNGAGTQSAPSSPSDGLTFDFTRPGSAVTTGGFYNAFNWPGFIYGTASDAPSDVAFIDMTLRDADSGQYWDGAAWVGYTVWLRAVGDTNWQYSFAPVNGHTYDVQSRATDQADNVQLVLGYNSFTYAAAGPQAPAISSSSHPTQTTWYNDAAPIFEWTTPPSGAGIQGYSFVLDQVPGTTPDTTLDTALNTQSYTGLADGVWYFHVRAQDNAGNWGPAGHYRVNIDTTAPLAPAEVTEDTPDVDWDADGNITVYWDPVTDLSGVTYTLERNINGAAYVQVATGLATTSYADFSTNADGATVRYRVRATNGVAMHSAWTESDGMTIDSSPPTSPTPVTEGDPDIDWSADGTVTARWAAVTDTGSGVTYRLERGVNGVWTTIAPALSANAYADSGAYNDDDFIQYRVTAVSGVGLASPPATSDGMQIDSQTPASPATLTEESPDVDWDYDGIFTVYWAAVADTGSGLTYRLERNLNNAGWTVIAPALTTTSFAQDIGNVDGTMAQYRVTAVSGVGRESAPRVSDGVTVDSQVVPQPVWVREDSATDPDRDYHPNADGAITVYWAAVTDTGSGITYRLEKRVNGGEWTWVAANLSGVFYPDSGAYADNDFIEYRVTAGNAVLTESTPRLSDGMRIDIDTPAAPTAVGEGDVPGVDDDFDQDNAFYVFWTASADTGSGLSYTVQRSRNGGLWEPAIAGLACATTPCQWDDPLPYSNGDMVQYRVLAVNGAGHASAASLPSNGITLDFAQPDSAVSTGGYYNQFNWPGMVRGTAADAISDVDFVDVTIYDTSSSRYWDGVSWETAETWLRATGLLNWQYSFAWDNLTDGHTYDVRSRATDRAGNVETSLGIGSFTFASAGPQAPAISSPSHPTQTTWYNNTTPIFEWTTPPSGAGVQGYSFVLDQVPGTIPDTTLDTTLNAQSYTGLADGVWYFHVRAQDNTGNWGPAGHYRVNIDTTPPPAPTEVTEDSPDVDWDIDGNITVYWNSVNDLSPVTYSLERTTNAGATWQLVASSITATAHLDPVSHPDATILHYRVRAVDAVGLTSLWTQSNGVTVDSETPAAPSDVGAGDVVGTADAWDEDNNFFVFWTATPNTGSGITYVLARSVNGGAWETAQTGYAQTFWDDPRVFNDGETIRYRVTAINGVNMVSAISEESAGITMDFASPDSAVSIAGIYGLTSWPGAVEGTASDTTSGVALVHITLQRTSDGQYWNGATWTPAPFWLLTSGTVTWTYAFTPSSDQSYNVQSRATDAAGNIEVSYGIGNFSYTTREPDSSVTTVGLYVGATWPGQINGTAIGAMAAVSQVDLTIQRSDGLYWDGANWIEALIWLRASDTGIWNYAFTPADSETYTVHSRATDMVGNVEGVYGNGTFSYNIAAPEITTVQASSDSIYFYNPGLTADGGVVYYNSRPNEGAEQQITVTVTFDEPHPASLSGGAAFGNTPPPATAAPWTVQYTASAYAGTQPDVPFTVADTLGLTDVAHITFVQDNMPPNSRASIAAQATNTTPLRIDWEANDGSSGIREVRLWVKHQAVGEWADTGMVTAGVSGSFLYTPTTGTGTYYFATVAVDLVNNTEGAPTGFGDAQIDFDDTPSASHFNLPYITYTSLSPFELPWESTSDAKYTYLYVFYDPTGECFPTMNNNDWIVVTFSQEKAGAFTFTPVQGEGHYYFATVAIDAAGNQEPIPDKGKALIIYDTTPPSSRAISPLDLLSHEESATFVVEWESEDGLPVGSGTADYDIQVKLGNGTWTNWLTHTSAMSATYTVFYTDASSDAIHFRSRARDNAGNLENWPDASYGDSTTTVFWGSFVGRYKLFLPLITRAHMQPSLLPDLVVTNLQVMPTAPQAGQATEIAVTIKNQGEIAINQCFWVDLYINPTRLPLQINEGWFEAGASGGLVWSVCKLNPGESLTLTYGDEHYWPEYSRFDGAFSAPGIHTLYVQVDSYNLNTQYGSVYESDEHNNIYGPQEITVTGAETNALQTQPAPKPRSAIPSR